jgi:hypothetical protein
MHAFVRRLSDDGVLTAIPLSQVDPVWRPDADILSHPWYDGGAVADWSRQRLAAATPPAAVDVRQLTARVAAFFAPLSDPAVERQAFLTVVEVGDAMALGPLVARAQDLSRICMPSASPTAAAAAAASGQDNDGGIAAAAPPSASWFKFLRGCAGQRSARDTAAKIIDSIGAQLSASGLQVLVVFSSLLILTRSGFDDALRNTGAVYRALTAQKVKIAGVQSMLDPRRPTYVTHSYTNTLSPSVFDAATDETVRTDRLVRASVDAFYLLLEDRYQWLLAGYLPPAEAAVVRAFAVFASTCLWPHAALLAGGGAGPGGWPFAVPDELVTAARPLLVAKPPAQGAASGVVFWTPLELRLLLLRTDAYSVDVTA